MPQLYLENPGAFIKTGSPATVSETSPFITGQAGTLVYSQSAIPIPSQTTGLPAGQFPRVWQYVQLDSGSATPAFGQFVVWKDAINFVVTTASSTTKRGYAAGVLCNASATLGDYVWIGVSGVFPILTENGQTPAAGDAVIGGASTAGRFGVVAQGTASNGGAIPLGIPTLGNFLATKTTAFNGSSALPTDTCAAFINIPRFGF